MKTASASIIRNLDPLGRLKSLLSHRYTKARLTAILGQLDPRRRNVVEFRHASWWNETVYAAFVGPAQSSALAAGLACRTNLSVPPTKST